MYTDYYYGQHEINCHVASNREQLSMLFWLAKLNRGEHRRNPAIDGKLIKISVEQVRIQSTNWNQPPRDRVQQ